MLDTKLSPLPSIISPILSQHFLPVLEKELSVLKETKSWAWDKHYVEVSPVFRNEETRKYNIFHREIIICIHQLFLS